MVWEARQTGVDTNGGGFRGGSTKSAPSAPTVSNITSGGSVAANTYYFVVTITDSEGETSKSAESSTTTTGATSTITVNSPPDPSDRGATWNVYCATASGGPYFSQSTGNTLGSNKSITATPATSGTQAPGTDRSQQDGVQVAIDNAAITATTPGANSNTLTFTAGYTPTAADVGNLVNMTGGTNITVARYEITGWTSTTWTLAGAANLTGAGGAGAALTGNMGGAILSPALVAGSEQLAGNIMFVKYSATPYSMSASTNVASGSISRTTAGMIYVGYNTTRTRTNTDALRPTLQCSANSVTLISLSSSDNSFVGNFIFDGNSKTSTTGLNMRNSVATNCHFLGLVTGFVTTNGMAIDCSASGCTTSFSTSGSGTFDGCTSVLHTTGFNMSGTGGNCNWCIAGATAVTAARGFSLAGTLNTVRNCVAYNHTGITNPIGFNLPTSATCIDCIAYGCTTAYSGLSTTPVPTKLINCAAGNYTTDVASGAKSYQLRNFITLTADPFTNAAGNDFSLNSTAGGGASLKGLGYPSSFNGLSTSSTPDVGAAQSSGVSTDPGVANVKSGTAYTIGGSSLTGTLVVPATGGGGMRGGFVNG